MAPKTSAASRLSSAEKTRIRHRGEVLVLWGEKGRPFRGVFWLRDSNAYEECYYVTVSDLLTDARKVDGGAFSPDRLFYRSQWQLDYTEKAMRREGIPFTPAKPIETKARSIPLPPDVDAPHPPPEFPEVEEEEQLDSADLSRLAERERELLAQCATHERTIEQLKESLRIQVESAKRRVLTPREQLFAEVDRLKVELKELEESTRGLTTAENAERLEEVTTQVTLYVTMLDSEKAELEDGLKRVTEAVAERIIAGKAAGKVA